MNDLASNEDFGISLNPCTIWCLKIKLTNLVNIIFIFRIARFSSDNTVISKGKRLSDTHKS